MARMPLAGSLLTDQYSFYRLLAARIVRQSPGGGPAFRCELYRQYLQQHRAWVRNAFAPPSWLTVPAPLFTPATFNGIRIIAQGLSSGAAYDANTTAKEPDGSTLSASRLVVTDYSLALNLAGLSILPTNNITVNF